MPVYVDDMRAPFGRMVMSHMLADSTAELLAMADTIGVRRRWLQKAGTPHEHFDIASSKRALAVQAGAIEIDKRRLVEIVRAKREKLKAAGTPQRVQLSRAKDWRMPGDAVKVDRTTRWGNPFVVGRDGTQADCVQAFGWLAGEEASLDAMSRVLVPPEGLQATEAMLIELQADPTPLRGKRLACWCSLDQPCHADVLLRLVNRDRHNDAPQRPPR